MLYNFIFILWICLFSCRWSAPSHPWCLLPQAGAGCSSQCMKWWFRMQIFGLALLKPLSPLMGLAVFLCLITRHPAAAGLVTQSSPSWQGFILMLRERALRLVWAQQGAVGLEIKWGTLYLWAEWECPVLLWSFRAGLAGLSTALLLCQTPVHPFPPNQAALQIL